MALYALVQLPELEEAEAEARSEDSEKGPVDDGVSFGVTPRIASSTYGDRSQAFTPAAEEGWW